MDKETLACFAFSYCPGIGPYRFSKLLQVFSSPSKAYTASFKELQPILGALSENLVNFRRRFNPGQEWEAINQKKVNYLSIFDKRYPFLLKQISDPPIGLFYKGNWSRVNWDQTGLAIVGTRKPSCYGIRITRQIVIELVRQGIIIISGLAQGIDSAAHQTTLTQQGTTLAVLGCGVNIVYPRENKALYEQIIDQNGLILSEFPPDEQVLKGLFVSRNRIVSGLSRGVLVVEGSNHSGSLITARIGREQGKNIFSILRKNIFKKRLLNKKRQKFL
jgi:DNA processing protein